MSTLIIDLNNEDIEKIKKGEVLSFENNDEFRKCEKIEVRFEEPRIHAGNYRYLFGKDYRGGDV